MDADALDKAAEEGLKAAERASEKLWPRKESLRMLQASAEAGAVGFWLALVPLSLAPTAALLTLDWITKRLPTRLSRGLRFRAGKWVVALYCLWMISDQGIGARGGRQVRSLRFNPLWELFRSYFRARVLYDFDEDDLIWARSQPHVIACHPHGVISVGVFANAVVNPLLPLSYRVVTLAMNFYVPVFRDLLLALGAVDAREETLNALLTRGTSVAIVVGGASEALDARPGTHVLTLAERYGFVRLALQHGAPLVPVFTFGENEVYAQVAPNPPGSALRSLQEWGKRVLGFSMPAIYGRLGPIPMPFRRRITTVVGKPLPVPLTPDPSEQQVRSVHAEYVRRLKDMYERHAPTLAPHVQEGLVIRDGRQQTAPDAHSKL